jgi:hypothetical protein
MAKVSMRAMEQVIQKYIRDAPQPSVAVEAMIEFERATCRKIIQELLEGEGIDLEP